MVTNKIKTCRLRSIITLFSACVVGGFAIWTIIRVLEDKVSKSGMYLFANIQIDSSVVYLPKGYSKELEHVDSLKARLMVDRQHQFEAFFGDCYLDEILDLCCETDSGSFYKFKKKPKHFLCYPDIHPEVYDSIVCVTDMCGSRNPLFTLKLGPYYRYASVRHKCPIGERLRFFSLPIYFAQRWYKPVSLDEVISSFHVPQFFRSDLLIMYVNKELPECGFLYVCSDNRELYGKVTQYPMILTGQDSRKTLLFETVRGAFYSIRSEDVKGPLRLFEWKPGKYVMWAGPVRDRVDYDTLRKVTGIAIQEANQRVFKEKESSCLSP